MLALVVCSDSKSGKTGDLLWDCIFVFSSISVVVTGSFSFCSCSQSKSSSLGSAPEFGVNGRVSSESDFVLILALL